MSSVEPNAQPETRLRPREWILFAALMVVASGVFAWRSHRRSSGASFERTPPAAAHSSEPSASAQAPSATSSTASDVDPAMLEAERVLKATKPLVRRCFLEERKSRPDVRGNLEVTIKVDSQGKASSIVLGPSEVRSAAFDVCVEKAFAEKISGSSLGSVDLTIDIGLK